MNDLVARNEMALDVDEALDELDGTLDAIGAGIPPEEPYMRDLAYQAQGEVAALRTMFQAWMEALHAGVEALVDERNQAVADLAELGALYEKDVEGTLMIQQEMLTAILTGFNAPQMDEEFRTLFVEAVQAIVAEANQRVLDIIREAQRE